jgi:uncharacterized membrane protein (TIGR02234 family)
MPEEDGRARPGRTFGPVVLLGLGSSALAAVASAKSWYGTSTPGGGDASLAAIDQGTKFPLASAASLVLLAAWGVLLVTRGVVRRVFAVLCLLAAAALVATVVAGHATVPDTARNALDAALHRGNQHPGFTGWFWTAAVASVLAVVAGVLAVRLVPSWPEMGSRYDAPAVAARAAKPGPEPDSQRDIWHALDEGLDPTRDPTRDPTSDPANDPTNHPANHPTNDPTRDP